MLSCNGASANVGWVGIGILLSLVIIFLATGSNFFTSNSSSTPELQVQDS
jgi:hypothetical protein